MAEDSITKSKYIETNKNTCNLEQFQDFLLSNFYTKRLWSNAVIDTFSLPEFTNSSTDEYYESYNSYNFYDVESLLTVIPVTGPKDYILYRENLCSKIN